ISGLCGVAGIAVGGAVAEDVILALHIFDAYAPNPSVSVPGVISGQSNSSLTLWGIGPELTYYVQPSNMYVTLTAGTTRMTVDRSGSSVSTDWGFGVRGALGKEWWVSDHWGIGAVVHLSYSANGDTAPNGTTPTLATWAFGAAFSATYN